jgi:DNA invertase Pin-like site-specific DNA recombinase
LVLAIDGYRPETSPLVNINLQGDLKAGYIIDLSDVDRSSPDILEGEVMRLVGSNCCTTGSASSLSSRAFMLCTNPLHKAEGSMRLGYARVSTTEQDLSGQIEALRTAGCERVYSEKKTGATGDRAALQRMLKEAQPGDVIVVTRLDRLARSTRNLLNILDQLSKDEIGFQSLRETAIDTTTPHGRLTISILASIAEFERELIQDRIREGRKRAVAAGTKFGPKFKLDSFQRREALARLEAGESQRAIARTYGVDPATISRLQRPRPETT